MAEREGSMTDWPWWYKINIGDIVKYGNERWKVSSINIVFSRGTIELSDIDPESDRHITIVIDDNAPPTVDPEVEHGQA